MKLQHAAELNQSGANLLAVGNYEAAYKTLGQAAATLRDLLHDEEPSEGSGGLNISSSVGCRMSALKQSDFYIFNRDFQFRLSDLSSRPSLSQKRFCVTIVMFNMALGRHVYAKHTGRDKHLEKALILYSMGLDVLQQIDVASECTTILAVALLNNMAEACYELGDIVRANHLLESITPLASTLSPAAASSHQVDECLMNQLLTGFVSTARCA